MNASQLSPLCALLLLTMPPVQAQSQGRFARVVSVVKNDDLSGVEQIEAWKAGAQVIASLGNETAKPDYEEFRRLVDAWVNRKKLEVSSASASTLGAKADLSRRAISPQMEECWTRLKAHNSTRGLGIGVVKGLSGLVVKGKAKRADLVNQQLENLRLPAWGSPN